MATVNAAMSELSAWLTKHLKAMPPELNLAYLEWNHGWNNTDDYRAGKPKSMLFALFSYSFNETSDFDPENPDHIAFLSDWAFDVQDLCVLPLNGFDEDDWLSLTQDVIQSTRELSEWLSERALAFGPHEGQVKVFTNRSPKTCINKDALFYELYVSTGANSIESYEIGGFDETQIMQHDRVKSWPSTGIALFLQQRARLRDFLRFYRGWLICSERAVQLFRSATDQVEVFPAPLLTNAKSGSKTVDGYFVVNLYEKLDCIAAEFVTPPAWQGGPKMFDPSRGYKIKRSAITDKQVFRLNYEYFRLVVSQQMRDRFNREGITGVEWLRRESVP